MRASSDFVGFVVGRTRTGFILGSGRPRSLAVSSVGLFFCGKVGRNLRLAGRSGAPRALIDEERRGAIQGGAAVDLVAVASGHQHLRFVSAVIRVIRPNRENRGRLLFAHPTTPRGRVLG